MRYCISLIAIALVFATGPACTCGSDDGEQKPTGLSVDEGDIFALDRVHLLHLQVSDKSIRRLKQNPKRYTRADMIVGSATFADIGVRLKGARSFRAFHNKPGLKLHLDRWRKGAALQGQDRFTLNNMVEDPTMLREVLGYEVFREMGVPAPRVGYARLYVNNMLYGLYAVVEHLGERFLERHFDDGSGGLYEGEYGCDLFGDDVDWFDQDSGKDKSRADLHEFARIVAGPDDKLFHPDHSPLDMDKFLAYLATIVVIGDFDSYRHSHNYRIYHEPTSNKWSFVPWGIDRAFKRSMWIYDSQGFLATRCFGYAPCRLAYIHKLREVADKFESMKLVERAEELAMVIDKVAREDRRKPDANERMDRKRKQLLGFLARRPNEIRSQTQCVNESGKEVDGDGDGYGCMDCDDKNANVHPGATESCDGVDNDCSFLIDDNPACSCPTREIDSAVFHLCNIPLPWVEAKAFCEAQGMRLAKIDTRKQARQLYDEGRAMNDDRWWIGLSDRGKEGIFRWEDGSLPEFDYWRYDDPDNAGCNQDCAAIQDGNDGYWHDTHCGQHRPFVCRKY